MRDFHLRFQSVHSAIAASLVVLCVLLSGGAGCAMFGEPYRVSPPISGTIVGDSPDLETVELRLNVIHRENPTLFSVQRRRLDAAAQSFEFDPVDLEVAGREYSKFYRVYLHHRRGSTDLVIWRGEFSRFDSSGPIILDCDLRRPPRMGQPCQVRSPLQHPWLVETGRQTFDRLCSDCHGPSGSLAGTDASPAPDEMIDLTRIASRNAGYFDAPGVAEWIEGTLAPDEHGPREMPIWGERLSEDYARYRDAEGLVGATLDPLLIFLMSIQR